MADEDKGRGRPKRTPPLDADLILAVEELRQNRAALWKAQREEAVRLRRVLPAVVAAGYSHRAAGKLLGISYATVRIILSGKRPGGGKA